MSAEKRLYECCRCGSNGVRLWRYGASSCVELECFGCIVKDAREKNPAFDPNVCAYLGLPNPAPYHQIAGRVPACPDLAPHPETWVLPEETEWWGITSIPPFELSWWSQLPLERGEDPKRQIAELRERVARLERVGG